MATRQGALMLALICAVAAAGILVFALGRYKQNVQTVTPQATVLVATGEIHQGTAGQSIAAQKLFKSMPITVTQLAPGAISDSSLLAGRFAAADILPGQQLTLADFASAPGVTGLLANDQRAVSVSIDEAHGDADVLLPGEQVDVYATFVVGAKGPVTVLLVPDALVIKPASAIPATAGGRALTGGALVLRVSAVQAPELGYAMDHGTLYLALRPPRGTVTSKTPTTLGSIIAAATGAGIGSLSTSGAVPTTSPTTTTTPTTTSTSNPTGTQ